METAIILFQCHDQKGIVAKISDFIFKRQGNIITADQHSTDPENGYFFMRVEFYFDEKKYPKNILEKDFKKLANSFSAQWKIFYQSKLLRMGILVSKTDHCLCELLYRWKTGEFPVKISFVMSQEEEHKKLVESYKIPFYLVSNEQKILNLVKDKTDFLVLARYMKILSSDFLKKYQKDIINIHHSFLPSFKGSNPYQQAFDRGVKVIGATAHFVTEDLDEGPIIEQMVEQVSHRDHVEDLKRKGKNLEKLALSNAIHLYIHHRIMRHDCKTIVFK